MVAPTGFRRGRSAGGTVPPDMIAVPVCRRSDRWLSERPPIRRTEAARSADPASDGISASWPGWGGKLCRWEFRKARRAMLVDAPRSHARWIGLMTGGWHPVARRARTCQRRSSAANTAPAGTTRSCWWTGHHPYPGLRLCFAGRRRIFADATQIDLIRELGPLPGIAMPPGNRLRSWKYAFRHHHQVRPINRLVSAWAVRSPAARCCHGLLAAVCRM